MERFQNENYQKTIERYGLQVCISNTEAALLSDFVCVDNKFYKFYEEAVEGDGLEVCTQSI